MYIYCPRALDAYLLFPYISKNPTKIQTSHCQNLGKKIILLKSLAVIGRATEKASAYAPPCVFPMYCRQQFSLAFLLLPVQN
jgi:hypothetical protein